MIIKHQIQSKRFKMLRQQFSYKINTQYNNLFYSIKLYPLHLNTRFDNFTFTKQLQPYHRNDKLVSIVKQAFYHVFWR